MNRIELLFQNKKKDILNVYFTAGYPKLDDTLGIMESLERSGVDLIEVGIPFSDPIADGPTIQASNHVALENGMSLSKLISQLKPMRNTVNVPVVLMGYLNPVMQYGLEKFCSEVSACGVDGLILPDLPLDEYMEMYKPIFDKHGLCNIFLITPQTSIERIRRIDECSSGFIYMVSSASITGAKRGISSEQIEYFKRIEALGLRNPRLIGFGISDHDSFTAACAHAQGAIIGSAFIDLLTNSTNYRESIPTFISSIKGN